MTTTLTAETLSRPMPLPLSVELKEATAATHDTAEKSTFMTDLMRGELAYADVVNLTSQYWFIYSALEEAVRRTSATPAVASVADPRIERLSALEHDLAEMIGADWREVISPTPATQRYVATLNSLGAAQAASVVAHHYVRYLGDIAGGQAIARMLADAYEIPAEQLTFYDFAAIGKIPPYRKAYKAALDSLPIDADEREELLDAAREAFACNTAVFNDLAALNDA